ncbi:hypothetical protein J1G34_23265 [Pseudomonas sp. Wu6]|uniref:Uncharacterized protein n=1 Tax=Pseudomonas orientalis TaxID=76758 RepID=A0A4Q7CWM0_9PSED|nr:MULTISPECIES: DUF6555 family protein [Pseudomonas]MBY8931965.1 hypothetical protein [Pseudomonas sp. Wu6]POM10911.1 hypothetical protein CUU62_00670 [Pseudomonas sp. WP001]RZI30764.1 hypothetical protein EUX57_15700 [Pseudomonas orientalis]CRM79064.1 hypothetical protein [Pseudomonas sp. 44 R 15]
MKNNELFTINYQLHGEPRSFIVRAARMNNAEAWHWASCDAGVAVIPRFGQNNLKRVSKPMAEKYGITDVRWYGAAAIQWAEGVTQ